LDATVQIAAAVAGGVVSSLVAGVLSYRQGKARARDERLELLAERVRRVELRSAANRTALRVDRRKRERKHHESAD
jgi:hypothetical protein